jgi:hypothetical protein
MTHSGHGEFPPSDQFVRYDELGEQIWTDLPDYRWRFQPALSGTTTVSLRIYRISGMAAIHANCTIQCLSTNLEIPRLSFVVGTRLPLICLASFRRLRRLVTYMPSLFVPLHAEGVSVISFLTTSSYSLAAGLYARQGYNHAIELKLNFISQKPGHATFG